MSVDAGVRDLEELTFDNRFTRELPADPNPVNSRRQVRNACYSRVQPTPASAPQLLAWSPEMADRLNLSPETVRSSQFVDVFAGNRVLDAMDPFAMCYGGHQFGSWAGQLGDGRAINLGEVINRRDERWMLQLKGAGPTPYSRTADGLAVVRSSVREFLCSEAMFHLGVPTTRALSLITTGDQVLRDMFYDGHPQYEPGAVVCRVAPSFTRFGNFQIFAARKDYDTLRQLIDYTIRVDFPHLGEPGPDVRIRWFHEICQRTAAMIVHWMRVGFVHGVMNTDNMSVLGLTIDYGPYGWLEDYDPNWTPNTTDAGGRRYRYGYQPQIALWNITQLANTLATVFDDVQGLQDGINQFTTDCDERWRTMMAAKLGLDRLDGERDEELVAELLKILQATETDMTLFYRGLARVSVRDPDDGAEDASTAALADAWYRPDEITDEYRTRLGAWLERYRRRLQEDGHSDEHRAAGMNAVNPKYVLRNYLAQLAIDKAEEGDPSLIEELLDVLRHPYDEQPGRERFAEKRPEWARHRAGCSMLSCSS